LVSTANPQDSPFQYPLSEGHRKASGLWTPLPHRFEAMMPARSLLSIEQRNQLFSMPTDPTEMVRHYTLGAADIVLIRTKRRSINRLGFELCLLKYPGLGMGPVEQPPEA